MKALVFASPFLLIALGYAAVKAVEWWVDRSDRNEEQF